MQLLWCNMYPQSELDNYKLQVDLLQEKLKQSEENRQQLQKELQQILLRRSEHDKSVRTKLRQKYQSFLDEQERRNERNQMLMQMLERIDEQSAALSARSERLKGMKLQYERYFAKLMQTQPVRCIQNATVTTGVGAEVMSMQTTMPAAAQIPVLLPAVAPQLPTTVQPTTTERRSDTTAAGVAAATPTQPTTGGLEAIAATQSAALTPRMWTFAMATPTPAGLLLTGGAPTAAMGSAPLQPATTPFEFVQYPLGYGAMQQQQPLQMAYASPMGPVTFGSRFTLPQCYGAEMSENPLNRTNTTEEKLPGKSPNTAREVSAMQKQRLAKQSDATTQRGEGIEGGSEDEEKSKASQIPEHLPADEQLEQEQHSGQPMSDKHTETQVTTASGAPLDSTSDVTRSMSEVKLEDDDDSVRSYVPYTGWKDETNKPKFNAKASERLEETFTKPETQLNATNTRQKLGPVKLHTAEEHRRKFAEIENKYGIADETNDMEDENPLQEYKPFSEIIKETNAREQQPPVVEVSDNNSWQSHSGSMEYTPKPSTSSTSTEQKPVSIDNIENAIYGELVNPQLDDSTPPTVRTAAHGFFTELLGQQEPANSDEISGNQHENTTTKDAIETQNLPANADNMGYANYSTSIDGTEAADVNAAAESYQNEPPNQATYDAANSDYYQQSAAAERAYDGAEVTNAYAEYPTDQTADLNAARGDAKQQLQEQQQQQQQQQEYTQQDYENYDATQYGNYDPNAYPGYIYDEATGQYVVDPQYVAPEGSAAEGVYATQEYQSGQGQEVSYAYEDNAYAAAAPTATDEGSASATPTTAEVANVPPPELQQEPTPEPAVTEPVAPPTTGEPKVLKPTSILSTADKLAAQNEAQKKKKRVNFVDSSETDDSSSAAKLPAAGAVGNESDFDFSSGAETSAG
ncbi:uncharacterized protein LOC118738106 [Rhagoletis pomonella]|uniref:uncharacterized protein LOC118738106 n=1 Tax=Rhagoletis pomonella TaxID=28610 RepID=UPI00177D0038|nr:uncharacterized protein LOC118738106 [Rhagoletis pomonella]